MPSPDDLTIFVDFINRVDRLLVRAEQYASLLDLSGAGLNTPPLLAEQERNTRRELQVASYQLNDRLVERTMFEAGQDPADLFALLDCTRRRFPDQEPFRRSWQEQFLSCWRERQASLRQLLSRLTQYSQLLGAAGGKQETPQVPITAAATEADPPDTSRVEAAGMPWEEAANRLEQLRSQGEPFTSQLKLAELFGCSSATINKAIRNTPSLQTWAKRPTAAPRAQSLNQSTQDGQPASILTDSTAQSRELDPEDEAAIREHLEREDLTAEWRVFFEDLPPEHKLYFLSRLDTPGKLRHIMAGYRRLTDPTMMTWFLSQSAEDQFDYLDDADKTLDDLNNHPRSWPRV